MSLIGLAFGCNGIDSGGCSPVKTTETYVIADDNHFWENNEFHHFYSETTNTLISDTEFACVRNYQTPHSMLTTNQEVTLFLGPGSIDNSFFGEPEIRGSGWDECGRPTIQNPLLETIIQEALSSNEIFEIMSDIYDIDIPKHWLIDYNEYVSDEIDRSYPLIASGEWISMSNEERVFWSQHAETMYQYIYFAHAFFVGLENVWLTSDIKVDPDNMNDPIGTFLAPVGFTANQRDLDLESLDQELIDIIESYGLEDIIESRLARFPIEEIGTMLRDNGYDSEGNLNPQFAEITHMFSEIRDNFQMPNHALLTEFVFNSDHSGFNATCNPHRVCNNYMRCGRSYCDNIVCEHDYECGPIGVCNENVCESPTVGGIQAHCSASDAIGSVPNTQEIPQCVFSSSVRNECEENEDCLPGFECDSELNGCVIPERNWTCRDFCNYDLTCVDEDNRPLLDSDTHRLSSSGTCGFPAPEYIDHFLPEVGMTANLFHRENARCFISEENSCVFPYECMNLRDAIAILSQKCTEDSDCEFGLCDFIDSLGYGYCERSILATLAPPSCNNNVDCLFQYGDCVDGFCTAENVGICIPPESIDRSSESSEQPFIKNCSGRMLLDTHFIGIPLVFEEVSDFKMVEFTNDGCSDRSTSCRLIGREIPGIEITFTIPAASGLATVQARNSFYRGDGFNCTGSGTVLNDMFTELYQQFNGSNDTFSTEIDPTNGLPDNLPVLRNRNEIPVTFRIGFDYHDVRQVRHDCPNCEEDPTDSRCYENSNANCIENHLSALTNQWALVPRTNSVSVITELDFDFEDNLYFDGVNWNAIEDEMRDDGVGFLGNLLEILNRFGFRFETLPNIENMVMENFNNQFDDNILNVISIDSLENSLESMLMQTLNLSDNSFPYSENSHQQQWEDDSGMYLCGIEIDENENLIFKTSNVHRGLSLNGTYRACENGWPQGELYVSSPSCGDGECSSSEYSNCSCLEDCGVPDYGAASNCQYSGVTECNATSTIEQIELENFYDICSYFSHNSRPYIYCGDDICGNQEEEIENCPLDCGFTSYAYCGDGICDRYATYVDREGVTRQLETCLSCVKDCGYCEGTCNNGICDSNESIETCPEDCNSCENGICDSNESIETCPEDCDCGNDICDPNESIETRPEDCIFCGNSVCDPGENIISCTKDCYHCGDGICSLFYEELEFCRDENNCEICPEDCHPCGDRTCGNCGTRHLPNPSNESGDENCHNNIDDNTNGLIDCEDPDCISNYYCYTASNLDIYTEEYQSCREYEYEYCPTECLYHCSEVEPGQSCCGDNVCDSEEDQNDSWRFCPEDCGYLCGDGVCVNDIWENWVSCPLDCSRECGDGYCHTDLSEDCYNCPEDCERNILHYEICLFDDPPYCGNSVCRIRPTNENGIYLVPDDGFFEDVCSCPSDCGPGCEYVCGDGECTGYCDENNSNCTDCSGSVWDIEWIECAESSPELETCPSDCSFCGDNVCNNDEFFRESPTTCPLDCGFCGNDICDEEQGETHRNCYMDCDDRCGDDICSENENSQLCSEDCQTSCGNNNCEWPETFNSCPWDCDENCGDNECSDEETTVSCAIDCGPLYCGDGLCNTDYNEVCFWDQNKGEFCLSDCGTTEIHCENDPNGFRICFPSECTYSPSLEGEYAYCGNEICEIDLGEHFANCSNDCASLCGDNRCDIDYNEPEVCPDDCCGDEICSDENGENESICAEDCYCGNGFCENVENAAFCPEDCLICGDGICNYPETIINCPRDCIFVPR